MSTRKSTRVNSRGVSPSLAPEAPATPGPRRSTRAKTPSAVGATTKAKLPTIGTKASTAYGINDETPVARAEGPQAASEIDNVLGGILRQEEEDDSSRVSANVRRSSRKSASRPTSRVGNAAAEPDLSGSFNQESSLFRDGDYSVTPSIVELDAIAEEPEPSSPIPFKVKTPEEQVRRENLETAAREHRVSRAPGFARNSVSTAKTFGDYVSDKYKSNIDQVLYYSRFCLGTIGVLVGLWLLFSTIKSGYQTGLSPFSDLSGESGISNFEAATFRKRITTVEDDIKRLNKEVQSLNTKSELSRKAIEKLEKILPDHIVAKKDKNGNPVLPQVFWQAIKEKLKADPSFAFEKTDEGRKTSGDGKIWDKFIKSNEEGSKAVVDDRIEKRFPGLLESSLREKLLLSKPEVIDLINMSLKENQVEVKEQISKLSRQLNEVVRNVEKHENVGGVISKDEVRAIARTEFSSIVSSAQLAALAKTNVQQNINLGLYRVNHFSPGTGARVDPYITSPSFIFPSMDINRLWRIWADISGDPYPVAKSPIHALNRWEEHGDCWCAPGQSSDIGVIMASNIIPEEIVIEHIKSSASLSYTSAPNNMELLAYIPDPDHYKSIKEESDRLFPDEAMKDSNLPFNYVRISTWSYNVESEENNIQAFPVQIDIRRWGADTNKMLVRTTSNWGKTDFTCIYRIRVHGVLMSSAVA